MVPPLFVVNSVDAGLAVSQRSPSRLKHNTLQLITAFLILFAGSCLVPYNAVAQETETDSVPTQRVPSDWPWLPVDIGTNQAFRLLFVTWDQRNVNLFPPLFGTIDASSTDIETYNAYVQGIAAQSNTGIKDFSEKFRALISTPDVDARDNTFTNRVTDTHPDASIHWLRPPNNPIHSRLPRIADNYRDFYDGWRLGADSIQDYSGRNGFIPLVLGNQRGFPADIWTGSNADGTGNDGFEAGQPVVRFGTQVRNNIHSKLALNVITRPLYAMSPRIITGPPILRLGTVNGTDLTLLGPVTLNNKTYYYWDRSGDGLSDNTDAVTHDQLDTLLNDGNDTVDTQSGGHTGNDDARSVIITDNLASYTLVLPNTTELSTLFSSSSPTGWSDNVYWSATQGLSTETHAAIRYENGANEGDLSDTTPNYVVFQLLTLAPTPPVTQTFTKESPLIPDANGDGPIVGESFRLLFISSDTINANSDNITVYNNFAQETAARFPYFNFSEQFRALISTPDVDARDNTNTIGDGVPIYWLDGDKVADDYMDFYDGNWDSLNGKDEIASTATSVVMWTGSNSDGTGDQVAGGAGANVNAGRLRAGQEISSGEIPSDETNKGFQNHLYIMSPIIKVASAPSITVPIDWALIPGSDFIAGQSFRLLFITSDMRNATPTDIETYNMTVQDTAGNATGSGMPIADFSNQFRALISTPEVDARDNTDTTGDGVPIYWLNGEKVADDYTDFYDGDWDSPNGKNEHGADIASSVSVSVWTGSLSDGTADTVNNREAGSNNAVIAGTLSSSSEIYSIAIDSTERHNLYALSPVINIHSTPTAPTSVTVTAANRRLNVRWNVPDDVGDSLISSYTATASADSHPARSCTTNGLFEVACTITELTNDVEYKVIVVATNDGGNSAPSLPTTATPTDLGICTRTQQVRDAIIAATNTQDCDAITRTALAAITSLDLSNKGITSLQGGDFDGLTSLRSLDLSSPLLLSPNRLVFLPADIFTGLERLTELHMNNIFLSRLPPGIFDNLTNLTELNLASNLLSNLSADVFSDLTNLDTLRLNDNNLSVLLSDIFSNLVTLRNLSLHDNNLSSLPSGIFNPLSGLISLDLSFNNLSNLPAGIFSTLTDLNSLRLNGNSLFTLNENIFSSLPTLSLLDLSHNFLNELHKNIFNNLNSLTELQLNFNSLSTLPTEIFANLGNLRILSLSVNQINELIPGTFDNLTKLRALSLDSNDLSVLPPAIFAGLSLEALFLSYNHLNVLPADIFHGMSSLQTLGVDSNDGDPGSPFELLLTLVRTDRQNDENGPATVSLRIAEGAPFAMTVPITISNGDVNSLDLTINAGNTESNSIMIDRSNLRENTVMTIGQIPAIPEDFSGIRLAANDALLLFFAAPTDVMVTPGNEQLRVSWTTPRNDANSLISGYQVTATGAGQTHRCTADAQTNACVITGLSNGIEYSVQVVASNNNGDSEPSMPVTGIPSTVAVCGRTPQVITAITKAISDNITCANVTATQLAGIQELNLPSSEVTVLQNGDFDGLIGLLRLDLSGNRLSTLPATIFNGLTSLRSLLLNDNDLVSLPPNVFAGLSNLDTLDLSDNPASGDDYTFTLTLARADGINFAEEPASVSLRIAEGAPFTITVPIITSNTGSITDVSGGEADRLTITAGHTESNVLTITHQTDSAEHASIALGTLPSIPFGFDGIQLATGDALQLFPAAPGIPTGVATSVFGIQKIRVSWTAPDDDGGSPITGYRADAVSVGQTQTYSCITNGADRTACTTMTLPFGVGEYLVSVVAINAVGESNPSIPTTVTFAYSFKRPLCERTPAVVHAINAQVPNACGDEDELLQPISGITHLDLSNSGITSLMSDDFDGLGDLTELNLSDNELTTLPETIFNSLTDLEVLDLSGNALNTLPANIFYDLINLRTLRLNDNDLTTLPETIFAGLTNLSTLNMTNNPDTDDDYRFNVSLNRVDGVNHAPGPASLSLRIAEGAPTALTFPIIVTGTATITDNAGNDITELTLAAGAMESEVFHITSTAQPAVGLGPAMLPDGFTGVQFVVREPLLLFFTPVCERTAQVADAIVAAVSVATCDEVTAEHLAEISSTNILIIGISSLKTGDFDGLSNLDTLGLSNGNLITLPPNILNNLTRLELLDLSFNELNELPSNIFGGLTNLQFLYLNDNDLVTLPPNIFDGLINLEELHLNDNDLVTLPPNIFDGLINLEELRLDTNDLVTLPPNTFAGLTNLQDFSIINNPDIGNFRLELTLSRVDAPDEAVAPASVVLELVEGAPTTITAQILLDGSVPSVGNATVTNTDGTPATELILSVGSTVSNTVRISNPGSQKVIVEIGTITTPVSTLSVERGIELVRNTLELFPTPVCERTAQVAEAIVAIVPTATDCNEVTIEQLADITTLDLSETSSLKTNDFDNLSGLQTLNLSSNSLNQLPEDIFAGLTNLLTLDLSSNSLSTLPATIFSDLTSLETLLLNDNDLVTLPPDIFAGLTNLLTLDLNSNSISTLPANIFSGLTGLETLRLNNNDLVTLPETIFAGFTNLSTLNMTNNPDTDDDYRFNLTLNRVDGVNHAPGPASLSLRIAEGAPTELTFPIIVTGTATVTDNAGNDITELTLTAGSMESEVFHVSSTAQPAVGLGPTMLPDGFTGVQFVVREPLLLFFTPVCERTAQVADAIVAIVPAAATCDEVTAEHLAEISSTEIEIIGVSSLQTGDFDGLSNLEVLRLANGNLAALPPNLFNNLTSLEILDLNSNELNELPPNIFGGLTSLESLFLNDNDLVTLPPNIFDGLTNLTELDLSSGDLSELPLNIFATLTNLETLRLNDNDLATLPPNIFAGLTRLISLNLSNNPNSGDSYTFIPQLTRTDGLDNAQGPATVSLRIAEGAPTKLSFLLATTNITLATTNIALATTNITISDTNVVTINAGAVESNAVIIERTGGTEKIMLAISQIVSGFPSQFVGMDLNTNDVLPLFPIPTVPMSPHNVTVTPASSQLTVRWDAPNDGNSPLRGFTVSITDPDGSSSSMTVDASTNTHTFTGLINNIEYRISVFATNDVGNSPPSDLLLATPRDVFRFRIKVFLEGAQ